MLKEQVDSAQQVLNNMTYDINSPHWLFYPKPNLKFTQYSIRHYGQPKLTKPKELKGIKQIFSIDYIPKKCKCPIYIKNDDIWIKHRDYFSPIFNPPDDKYMGKPLNDVLKKYFPNCNLKPEKFIYSDNWSSSVLRNEAWICIKYFISCVKQNCFELDILDEILRQQEIICDFKKYDLCCTDMERFWEEVINKTKRYITK
jgi:hypothetical protein